MAGSTWPALTAGARAKASEVEAKFDWVEQDLVPMLGGTKADNSYDLGTSGFRWRDAYLSRQLLLPAGSAGTPSIALLSSANGLYFPTTTAMATTNPLHLPNGAVGLPALSFVNSPTSGFYRIGADNIGYAAAGVKAMDISSAGEIVRPLQPAFLAKNSFLDIFSSSSTVEFDTEIFDQNGDYDNSTDTFTAPVTGRYLFAFQVFADWGSGPSAWCHIITSNRNYLFHVTHETTTTQMTVHGSMLCDMDVGDTASIQAARTGGGSIGITAGNAETYFSGFLI